ncbi:UDP-2,4-diacetamido-2,4,6-trideoxy-beta-L-altropyranose hydrolase [Candidatus Woesearchaeota archaeon CG10_big_fil_rev_8_21_14_0_10_45_16]|nr:MAG: UDP-2,4-diacetamido-2,4,6-trideoxy-beta-L-altropyranose hydrolase [Candidatus Woesearchaeota archaeon CG10_big_fil_rev_8_21_14_0_10_45_16]
MKTIAIRTDGSQSYGMGHVQNALTLAAYLKRYDDFSIYFVMIFPEGMEKVRQHGYDTETLRNDDLKELLQVLKRRKTDLLITDLLEIKEDYSEDLQKANIKSVCCDILGRSRLKADLLFNRTVIEKRWENYDRNSKTKFFLGTRYVVLKPEYGLICSQTRNISQTAKNVLITMGGGDEFNITTRVVRILKGFPDLSLTVVLGSAFADEDTLREAVKGTSIKIIKDVPSLAKLFLENDIVIGAGGSTLYELACTGTPALIIPMNDHQVENAEAFAAKGSVISTRIHSEATDKEIGESFIKIADNSVLRKMMSNKGKKITDGKGAERVAEIIQRFASSEENV